MLVETDFYDVHSWWRATDPGRKEGVDPWCHGPYWSHELAIGVLRSYGRVTLRVYEIHVHVYDIPGCIQLSHFFCYLLALQCPFLLLLPCPFVACLHANLTV